MQKLNPIWRIVAATVALVIVFFEYLGFKVGRAINGYYFHDTSVPVSAVDIAWAALAIFLLLIAASGRFWLPRRKVSP